MRLIDADALMDDIKNDTEKAFEQDDRVGSFWLGYLAELVIKQPTIQPEKKPEIIRCKDCQYFGIDCQELYCRMWQSYTAKNGYCHLAEKAERRTDGQNR